ncbi:6552_t:CDS:2 [Gigaspora margarita]|uniref:6552_t:CDS:1 n=1 Tax=Gigaspora margarita TaxID=4874 RepID=A0ABN7V7V6_GIGMA|nr:6552_t:CDS:2 [Gigaspora margarita]
MTRGNVQWRKAKFQFSAADKEWLNNDHAPKIAIDIDVEAALQKLSEWKLNEPELYESIRNIISSARDSAPIERVCDFIRKMHFKKHRAPLTNNQEMKLTMNHSYNPAKRTITMCTTAYRNNYNFNKLPNILVSVIDWTIVESYDMPLFPLDYPNYLCLSHVWTDREKSNFTSMHAGSVLFLQNDTLCKLKWVQKRAKSLGFKYIWFDMLCINNSNIEIKTKEIYKMHQHYFRSAGALIIGDMPVASVNSIAGLNDIMDKLFKDGNTATEVAYYLRDIVAYISIISWIKWFTRIWTTQEYVLANEVFISSQDSVVPCKTAFKNLMNLSQAAGFLHGQIFMHAFSRSAFHVINVSDDREHLYARDVFSILEGREGSDNGDYLYGILGLFPNVRFNKIHRTFSEALEDFYKQLLQNKDVTWLMLDGQGIFPDLTKLNKYFIKFVSETNEAVFNSVKEIKSECGICIQGVMAAIVEIVSQSVFSHPMGTVENERIQIIMELEQILGKRWLEILTMSMWPSITKEEIEKHLNIVKLWLNKPRSTSKKDIDDWHLARNLCFNTFVNLGINCNVPCRIVILKLTNGNKTVRFMETAAIPGDIVMHIATPSKTDLTLGWILRNDKTTGHYKRISTLTIEPQISTCKERGKWDTSQEIEEAKKKEGYIRQDEMWFGPEINFVLTKVIGTYPEVYWYTPEDDWNAILNKKRFLWLNPTDASTLQK